MDSKKFANFRNLAKNFGTRVFSSLKKTNIFDSINKKLTREQVTQAAQPAQIEEKIDAAVNWGKKKVENWGVWLKNKATKPVVNEEIYSFKKLLEKIEGKDIKQYEIKNIGEISNKKFKTFFDKFRVEPNQSTEISVDKILMEMANKVINKRGLKNGDKIRWIISHPSWNKPISSKLITIKGKLDSEITNKLSGFVEYKQVPLSEVKFEIQSTKIPRGAGRLIVTKSNLKRKKSVITIKNDDSICLARAIVTAVANINKSKWTQTQLKDGFNRSRKLQKDMAEKLHEEAGVEINEFGSTLEDVKTFANHLKIQINIVDGEYFNELMFSTENEHNFQMIYLYKNGNHFDVITSMTGFLCKSYYCHTCKKPYKKRDCHKCPAKCIACFKYFPTGNKCDGKVIECNDCNRCFFGKKCFEEHKRERKIKEGAESDIVCEKVCKCLKCGRIVTGGFEKHICGHSECSNCGEYCDMNEHRCFMVNKNCKGGNCVGCVDEKKVLFLQNENR